MAATVEAQQRGKGRWGRRGRQRTDGSWPANARWNFVVLGADVAFFTFALNIASAYIVLPLFVHQLTADNTAVALITALRALGLYAPQLLVAAHVERRRHALPLILRWTVLERVPYLALALATVVFARSNPGLLLLFFYVMILLALGGGGLTFPAWLDLIARAMPKNWLGRFLGFWQGVGGFFGIGGAALAAFVLAQVDWPFNFALCFLLTFAAMVVSFVLLALGREPPRTLVSDGALPVAHEPRSRMSHGGRACARSQLAPGSLAPFLTPLLAPLSLPRPGVGARRGWARSGRCCARMVAYVVCSSPMRSAGSPRWPQPCLPSRRSKSVASRMPRLGQRRRCWRWPRLAATSSGGRWATRWGTSSSWRVGPRARGWPRSLPSGRMAWSPTRLIFLLMGLNLAATFIAGLTFIAEFGPEVRRPTYSALSSVAFAPFAVGTPLLAGWLADLWGYQPVFMLSALAGVFTALCFVFWVPDPRKRARQAARTATAPVGADAD